MNHYIECTFEYISLSDFVQFFDYVLIRFNSAVDQNVIPMSLCAVMLEYFSVRGLIDVEQDFVII